MFPSGLPGIVLLLLRTSRAIVVFFVHIVAPLAMAIQFAGAWVAVRGRRIANLSSGHNATFLLVAALMASVAISDRAFESMASAIH